MKKIQTYKIYPKKGFWTILGPKNKTYPNLLFSTQREAINRAESLALYVSGGAVISICGKNGKERRKYKIFSITRVMRIPIKE